MAMLSRTVSLRPPSTRGPVNACVLLHFFTSSHVLLRLIGEVVLPFRILHHDTPFTTHAALLIEAFNLLQLLRFLPPSHQRRGEGEVTFFGFIRSVRTTRPIRPIRPIRTPSSTGTFPLACLRLPPLAPDPAETTPAATPFELQRKRGDEARRRSEEEARRKECVFARV